MKASFLIGLLISIFSFSTFASDPVNDKAGPMLSGYIVTEGDVLSNDDNGLFEVRPKCASKMTSYGVLSPEYQTSSCTCTGCFRVCKYVFWGCYWVCSSCGGEGCPQPPNQER